MFKIVLVTHGVIAKGFYDTLPMILGTQSDFAYICLDETKTVECFQQEVEKQILETWSDYEILVLADMMNGTPSRIAAQTLAKAKHDGEVICGLNLNLMLDAYVKRSESLKEVVEQILEAGTPSFLRFDACVTNEENE